MTEELYERGKTFHVNDIDLYFLDEGEGDPVLLLHGFPDSARLWRLQIPALGEAGYRVIAPDLRGFGRTSRPDRVEAYAISNVVVDVVGLLDHLEIDVANVVGHDWGAGVAWGLAAFLPSRCKTLTALSVGHPVSFGDRTNLRQLQASWYMLLFQFEGIAEELLSRNDWAFARSWLKNEIDLERYIEDLSRPGALTAALNWYRANAHPKRWVDDQMDWPQIELPVMGMWSTGDFALTEKQMVDSGKHLSGPWRYEQIEAPSHWIPLHAPDKVNELLLDFLGNRL
ncbi:MAG: alpha/beta hydrolase [Actinomycetota bacterium]|nr:alpha/beta hydrolase [Actinomycetota bacterium]